MYCISVPWRNLSLEDVYIPLMLSSMAPFNEECLYLTAIKPPGVTQNKRIKYTLLLFITRKYVDMVVYFLVINSNRCNRRLFVNYNWMSLVRRKQHFIFW